MKNAILTIGASAIITAVTCLVAAPAPGLVRSTDVAASQAPAPANEISGKWHFVYQTEGGDRDSDADFKVDGDQVTGKWNGTADVKGTFKDGALDLAFPYNSDEAGMTATLKMKGKLQDGKLAGNWEFADYSGTFVATRPK